jgi:hypothetical protein
MVDSGSRVQKALLQPVPIFTHSLTHKKGTTLFSIFWFLV